MRWNSFRDGSMQRVTGVAMALIVATCGRAHESPGVHETTSAASASPPPSPANATERACAEAADAHRLDVARREQWMRLCPQACPHADETRLRECVAMHARELPAMPVLQ